MAYLNKLLSLQCT